MKMIRCRCQSLAWNLMRADWALWIIPVVSPGTTCLLRSSFVLLGYVGGEELQEHGEFEQRGSYLISYEQ